ncbi:hypothetical protein FSP39_021913 [Pinctada imbricata]|uniref:BTB domain-containing protein n=1 Tax=Pinctada imbricata TaxID=66713 RepID=A0AA88YEM5_PINIB|nr:hypothetical protein FSP39_021913 [Pinctada imbricata]
MELPTQFIKLEEKPTKSNRMSMTLPRTASITLPPKKDWREGKSMAQRNLYMLENQLDCDIVFEFPSDDPSRRAKKIRAHSFMLRSASQVFDEMMTLSPRRRDPLQIKSVDPVTFRILLEYIYTEEIELSFDNVSQLLKAADKYKIPGLRQKCLEFMENDVTEETVCVILDEAVRMDHGDLVQKCLRYIDKDTSDVFKSPGFSHPLCGQPGEGSVT